MSFVLQAYFPLRMLGYVPYLPLTRCRDTMVPIFFAHEMTFALDGIAGIPCLNGSPEVPFRETKKEEYAARVKKGCSGLPHRDSDGGS
jgi:hypothetical protein